MVFASRIPGSSGALFRQETMTSNWRLPLISRASVLMTMRSFRYSLGLNEAWTGRFNIQCRTLGIVNVIETHPEHDS